MNSQDPKTIMLRHSIATLAYRAAKVLRDAPETFAFYSTGEKGRTPSLILAHMGDLMEWGLSMANGTKRWHDSTPLPWSQEIDRFFRATKAFDDYLASEQAVNCPVEKLFQGPVADALTHTGQLAMLRRMAGCPIRGENYFRAEVTSGRVGPDQARPAQEF